MHAFADLQEDGDHFADAGALHDARFLPPGPGICTPERDFRWCSQDDKGTRWSAAER
jgi:hypothetical protein